MLNLIKSDAVVQPYHSLVSHEIRARSIVKYQSDKNPNNKLVGIRHKILTSKYVC